MIQLYRTLHPENTETTKNELKDITIKNVLVQIKLYGRTREAIINTINICKDRDILKEYLSSREKEVVDMMMTLFDE